MTLTDLDARLRQHRQDLAETINAVLVEQTPEGVLHDLSVCHEAMTSAMATIAHYLKHDLATVIDVGPLVAPTPPVEEAPLLDPTPLTEGTPHE